VEVESDVESEWSGLGGKTPRLEAGGLSCLGRSKDSEGAEWALKRIAQGLDRGWVLVVKKKLRILL